MQALPDGVRAMEATRTAQVRQVGDPRYYEVVDWENYKPSVRHRRSDEGPQPFVQMRLVDQQVVEAVWETGD